MPDRFGGRTQPSQILRVECAERRRNSRPDSQDAFFHIWPKQRDPKLAAKKQLRTAHCGRAPGMGGAIKLHLFDRWCRIVHNAVLARSVMTVFVHQDLQRTAPPDWM